MRQSPTGCIVLQSPRDLFRGAFLLLNAPLQLPANRIGFQQAGFSVGQLRIVQEVITLVIFGPFAMIYLKEPFKFDYVWAAFCMVDAVFFIFRAA